MLDAIEEDFNHEQSRNYFMKNDLNLFFKKIALPYGLILVSLSLSKIPRLFVGTHVWPSIIESVLALIINFYIYGYFINITYNRIHEPNINIFNFKYDALKNISDAFKAFFAGLIYSIPSFILIFLAFECLLKEVEGNKTAAYVTILFLVILMISLIVFSLLWYLGYILFLMDLKFNSFFDFKKMQILILVNKSLFLKLCGWVSLYIFLAAIAKITLRITLIGTIAVPIVIIYLGLVASDLHAQFVRIVFGLNRTEQEQ